MPIHSRSSPATSGTRLWTSYSRTRRTRTSRATRGRTGRVVQLIVAKRAEKPETAKTLTVLPVQLRLGDTFTDDAGTWEVVGSPRSQRAGKSVVARVQRPGDPGALREQRGRRDGSGAFRGPEQPVGSSGLSVRSGCPGQRPRDEAHQDAQDGPELSRRGVDGWLTWGSDKAWDFEGLHDSLARR
jgi:hypothetical protein